MIKFTYYTVIELKGGYGSFIMNLVNTEWMVPYSITTILSYTYIVQDQKVLLSGLAIHNYNEIWLEYKWL